MVVWVGLASGSIHAAGDTNQQLLRNPGFEMGTYKQPGLGAVMPKHWSRSWRKVGSVEPVSDPKQARSGDHCVRVINHSIHQGRFEVVPGMRYRVRAWVKAESDATQTIAVYQYVWQQIEDKEELKNIGSWGFRGSGEKVPEEWSMVESVYTAPADGSVDAIAVAFHIRGPGDAMGSVLIDDVSVRAWDGRSLAVRVAASPIFRDRPAYEQAMARHPSLRESYENQLNTIYARAEQLRADAENTNAPLPMREEYEDRLEQLLSDYTPIQTEFELDLEEF